MKKFNEWLIEREKIDEANFKNLALSGVAGLGLMGNPASANVDWKGPEHHNLAAQFDKNMSQKLSSKEEAMKKYSLNEKDWWNLTPKDRTLLLAMTKLGEDHPVVKNLSKKDAMPFGWR